LLTAGIDECSLSSEAVIYDSGEILGGSVFLTGGAVPGRPAAHQTDSRWGMCRAGRVGGTEKNI
jgi:hypothetical protein